MFNFIKNLHKKYKEIEPYSLLCGAFGIGGGSIMTIWGSLKAASSPIVDVLGRELSFVVGATLIILFLVALTNGFLFFKKIFTKEKKSETKQLIEALSDGLNPKKLASKLSDRDICKLVRGSFNENKSLFTFDNPVEIEVYQHFDKKGNQYEKSIDLVRNTKNINIGFRFEIEAGIFNPTVKVCINYDWKEVPKDINEIGIDYNLDNPVKFHINDNKDSQFKIFMLIKSFTV